MEVHAIIAVLYPVAGHPLIVTISALSRYTCHYCETTKIHLKPLIEITWAR